MKTYTFLDEPVTKEQYEAIQAMTRALITAYHACNNVYNNAPAAQAIKNALRQAGMVV